MLYFFLSPHFSELGAEGLVGYFWKDIPVAASLLLAFVYILVPYLLGSVNTAIIVSDKFYHDDIRNYGSGNAGFTNIMRIYGKRAAVITFVGDFLKTVLAIMIGWCCFGYLTAYIAGFACFLGHIFPVYYRFRGGKGILCLTAMLFMLDWRIFLVLLAIFLLVVAMTKYISFGSVLCSVLYPLLFNRMNKVLLTLVPHMYLCQLIAVAVAVIVVIKHWGNLRRIFDGTESKFRFKKSRETAEEETPAPTAPDTEKEQKINYGALPGQNAGKKKKK